MVELQVQLTFNPMDGKVGLVPHERVESTAVQNVSDQKVVSVERYVLLAVPQVALTGVTGGVAGDSAEAVVPGTVVLEPGIVLSQLVMGALVQTVVSGMRLLIPPVAEKFHLMRMNQVLVSAYV